MSRQICISSTFIVKRQIQLKIKTKKGISLDEKVTCRTIPLSMSFDTVMCAIDRLEHVPEMRMSTQLDHFDKENAANNSKFQHISLSIRYDLFDIYLKND